jgi:hypothetical protein
MKYAAKLPVLVAAAAALAACDTKDPIGVQPTSQVQFINATADVAALNFAVNGAAAAENVAFGVPTVCRVMDPGAVAFSALDATTMTGWGAPLDQPLAANGRFTVVATGTANDPHWLFLNDATTAPATGHARLRIVNAVPGATASDIFVTAPGVDLGTATATNIEFNTATTFVDVPAGATQIRFTGTGTQDVFFTGGPLNLTAGQTTTLIVAPGTTAGTYRTVAVQPC